MYHKRFVMPAHQSVNHRNGVNSIWTVKNSTKPVVIPGLTGCPHSNISSDIYVFSTLYTSIPHNLLKSRITALHLYTTHSRGEMEVTYLRTLKLQVEKEYFMDTINPGGDNLYTADQICRMVQFLITPLLSLEDVFFVRSLGFQWEWIVAPHPPPASSSLSLLLWKRIFRQHDKKWPQETC